MISACIISNPDTVRISELGSVSGQIWLAVGEAAFPAEGWDDFILVLLEAWTEALLRLLSGNSHEQCVHFMEGPYEVRLSLIAPDVLELNTIRRDRDEHTHYCCNAMPLAQSVLDNSRRVVAAYRKTGQSSEDVDRLERLLSELARLVH